jgi:L-xylulokinase
VESSATSAVNLEWFIDNIIRTFGNIPNKEIYRIIEEKIEKIEPQECSIIYMPFLYKSHLSENLDACFWGIKPEYDIFYMLRSVFEGVVFAHRKHIENLKHGGIIRNRAVLSGGASNNRLWCQMFADVLNMEVATTQTSQVGALGTAVCTAVAMGQYKNLKEAIDIMIKEKNRYYPDTIKNEVYIQKYNEFNRIIDRFDKD